MNKHTLKVAMVHKTSLTLSLFIEVPVTNKGNNKINELRTILQRESKNS
jgi:hypothetical protein